MTRISLQEQYDNKDVIQQIYNLKKTQEDMVDSVDAAVTKADQAFSTASSFKTAIDSVVAEQGRLTEEIGAQTQQIQDIQSMTTTAVNSIRNETQASLSTMENTISTQDITGMVVGIAGTGKFNVTAQRPKGNVVSNTYDTCKVTKATLGKGALNNSVYVELTLSDGSVVRSGDAVIDISGVEADVHVTGCTLYEGENDHSLYLEFTLNDGTSFRSNTVSYDYPGIASSTVPGLVKSGANEGEVQVTSDGIPSVIGYSTLKASVEKNKTDIATNATNIQANDDAITAIEGQIGSDEAQGTIRGEIASLKAADTAMDARITTNTNNISTLNGNITALDTKVDDAVTAIANKMARWKFRGRFSCTPNNGSSKQVRSSTDSTSSETIEVGTFSEDEIYAVSIISTSQKECLYKLKLDQSGYVTITPVIYESGSSLQNTAQLSVDLYSMKRAEYTDTTAWAPYVTVLDEAPESNYPRGTVTQFTRLVSQGYIEINCTYKPATVDLTEVNNRIDTLNTSVEEAKTTADAASASASEAVAAVAAKGGKWRYDGFLNITSCVSTSDNSITNPAGISFAYDRTRVYGYILEFDPYKTSSAPLTDGSHFIFKYGASVTGTMFPGNNLEQVFSTNYGYLHLYSMAQTEFSNDGSTQHQLCCLAENDQGTSNKFNNNYVVKLEYGELNSALNIEIAYKRFPEVSTVTDIQESYLGGAVVEPVSREIVTNTVATDIATEWPYLLKLQKPDMILFNKESYRVELPYAAALSGDFASVCLYEPLEIYIYVPCKTQTVPEGTIKIIKFGTE